MLTLPLNGALMTPEQYDALEAYIHGESSTPMEKAMFRQMDVMVKGATAHKLLLENETTCRMTAERQVRDLQRDLKRLEREKTHTEEAEASEAALLIVLGNLQAFMQSLPKRPKVVDYKTLVEQMSAEIEKAMSEESEGRR